MHRLTRRLVAGALLCLVAGCAAQVTAPDRPAHHRDGGFQNNYAEIVPKGLATVLRWRWDSYRAGLPLPPAAPVPTVAPDLAFLQANARAGTAMEPAVTWIGHASTLVQLGGLNVLTDPIFSERASPLSFVGPRRAQPRGSRWRSCRASTWC